MSSNPFHGQPFSFGVSLHVYSPYWLILVHDPPIDIDPFKVIGGMGLLLTHINWQKIMDNNINIYVGKL